MEKMKYVSLLLILVLVLSGCSTLANNNVIEDEDITESSMKDGEMSDDDMMEDEEMSADNMIGSHDDDMMGNEGALAPDFTFESLDGEIVSLSSLEGEKVYLKYWASWCSICLSGLSEIEELAMMDHDYKVYTVVTPGANGEQSKDDFITWFNGLENNNFEVLFDTDGEIARKLGVRGFPTSVFIGSDSVLIEVTPGHKNNSAIEEMMTSFY